MVRTIDLVADLPIDRRLHIARFIVIAHHGAKARHIPLTSLAARKSEPLRREGLARVAGRRRRGLHRRRGACLVAGGEQKAEGERGEAEAASGMDISLLGESDRVRRLYRLKAAERTGRTGRSFL